MHYTSSPGFDFSGNPIVLFCNILMNILFTSTVFITLAVLLLRKLGIWQIYYYLGLTIIILYKLANVP